MSPLSNKVLGLLIAACLSFPAAAKPVRGPRSVGGGAERLKASVEEILNPRARKDLKYAIVVSSTASGETLFEAGADEQLVPASVNKVFTAYSVLKKLRPTFTFKTSVYGRGTLSGEKLSGDLYVRGTGDPSLVSERMWMLVNDLKRSGIRAVTGNLIVDSSYYDTERVPGSRPKYLKDQAYNAPIGALSFNFNTTTIFVKPALEVGKPPIVYTDPENSYIDVVNQATTGGEGSKNSIQVSRTEYVKGDIGDTVLLRGSLPLDARELRFYRNIVNPGLYAGHMLKTFMEQRGITLAGNILEGGVPSEAKLLLDFESQPLWHIVWGMNKFSNNFVADQLMKKLGAEMWGAPGTMDKGILALQDILEDIGIPKKSYSIVDGSGLTRSTHVSARQVNKLLLAAHRDFGVSPEFISSLGIAGEDGTLRSRLPSSVPESAIRAKTGTLDGVSSLAGFVPSRDGELLAFTIILNDPRMKYGRMSHWVDRIAQAVAKFSRG